MVQCGQVRACADGVQSACMGKAVAQAWQSNQANCRLACRMTNTAIARASDDFYPRDPASSQPHIAACAFNSVGAAIE